MRLIAEPYITVPHQGRSQCFIDCTAHMARDSSSSALRTIWVLYCNGADRGGNTLNHNAAILLG